MKVEQTNMREVVFDCPWTGHAYGEGGIEVRNLARPDIVGLQCVKCGALVYERVKSRIITPEPPPPPVLDIAAREGGD